MEETIEMVKEGEMPLNSYTWTHKDARLTEEEKAKIINWAESVMDTMKAITLLTAYQEEIAYICLHFFL